MENNKLDIDKGMFLYLNMKYHKRIWTEILKTVTWNGHTVTTQDNHIISGYKTDDYMFLTLEKVNKKNNPINIKIPIKDIKEKKELLLINYKQKRSK